jgi:hypothetical protein
MKEQGQCTGPAVAARSGKQSRRATQERLGAQVLGKAKLGPRLFAPQPRSSGRNSEGRHRARSRSPSQVNHWSKAGTPAAARAQGWAFPARRCLTPRSSRAPTASHQARSVARYILHSPGLAPSRWYRLSSNVRQRSGSFFVHRCSLGSSQPSKPRVHRVRRHENPALRLS